MLASEIKDLLRTIATENDIKLTDERLVGIADTLYRKTTERHRPMPPAEVILKIPAFKETLKQIMIEANSGYEAYLTSFRPQENDARLLEVYTQALATARQQDSDLNTVTEEILRHTNPYGLARRLKHYSNDRIEYIRYLESKQKQLKELIEPKSVSEQTSIIIGEADYERQLMTLSLNAFSQMCMHTLTQTEGPALLIHFYEPTSQPRRAEYLEPYDSEAEEDDSKSFVYTNHGLGAAVYGVASLDAQSLQRQLDQRSCFEVVEIARPLRLNDWESDRYTEVSKWMQNIATDAKRLQSLSRQEGTKLTRSQALMELLTSEPRQSELSVHAKTLSQFEAIEQSRAQLNDILIRSFENFMRAAKTSKQVRVVPMPINFVMQALGFTGVVSENNNRFSRGLIAFEANNLDLSEWDATLVKALLLRTTFAPVRPGAGGKPIKADQSREQADPLHNQENRLNNATTGGAKEAYSPSFHGRQATPASKRKHSAKHGPKAESDHEEAHRHIKAESADLEAVNSTTPEGEQDYKKSKSEDDRTSHPIRPGYKPEV